MLLDKKGGNLFSFSLMKALFQHPSIDLLHLHTGKRLGGIGRYVAKKRKIPYMVSIHGGAYDVPVEEAYKIYKEIADAGKVEATLVIISGADHSMRIAPPDQDDETRFREKFDYNYNHPFSEFFIHSLIGWTLDQFNILQAT